MTAACTEGQLPEQFSLTFFHFPALTMKMDACLPHVTCINKLTEHLLFASECAGPWGQWQVRHGCSRNWQAGTTCDHLPPARHLAWCFVQGGPSINADWSAHLQQQSARGATDEAIRKDQSSQNWRGQRQLPYRGSGMGGGRSGRHRERCTEERCTRWVWMCTRRDEWDPFQMGGTQAQAGRKGSSKVHETMPGSQRTGLCKGGQQTFIFRRSGQSLDLSLFQKLQRWLRFFKG